MLFCEDEPYFKKSEINDKPLKNDQVRPIAHLLDELDFIPNEDYENESNN